MDKNILKQLYQRKDRKRKKALLSVYKEIIFQETSLDFIREIINSDLGGDFVAISDLKYVRHLYKKSDPKNTANRAIQNINLDSPSTNNNTLSWTSEDEIINKKSNIKSKFSK